MNRRRALRAIGATAAALALPVLPTGTRLDPFQAWAKWMMEPIPTAPPLTPLPGGVRLLRREETAMEDRGFVMLWPTQHGADSWQRKSEIGIKARTIAKPTIKSYRPQPLTVPLLADHLKNFHAKGPGTYYLIWNSSLVSRVEQFVDEWAHATDPFQAWAEWIVASWSSPGLVWERQDTPGLLPGNVRVKVRWESPYEERMAIALVWPTPADAASRERCSLIELNEVSGRHRFPSNAIATALRETHRLGPRRRTMLAV